MPRLKADRKAAFLDGRTSIGPSGSRRAQSWRNGLRGATTRTSPRPRPTASGFSTSATGLVDPVDDMGDGHFAELIPNCLTSSPISSPRTIST